jgi:hypothetical protein
MNNDFRFYKKVSEKMVYNVLDVIGIAFPTSS